MSDNSLDVSVIIATYNRAEFLRQTLETLVLQDFPSGTWEILVINNRSTDNTEEVVHEFMAKHSLIRLVREEKQGLSHARNRGIGESLGRITVHLDDDVLLEPHWLTTMVAPLQNDKDRKIGVLGGRTINCFPEDKRLKWAVWFRRSNPYSETLCQLHESPFPIGGGNLAVPHFIYDEVGDFKTELGRNGSIMLCGEDTEFIDRVWQAGFEIWYNGPAKLLHQIPASRLTFASIYNHCYHYGRSSVIRKISSKTAANQPVMGYLIKKTLVYVLSLPFLATIAFLCLITCQTGKFKSYLARIGRSLGRIHQTCFYLLGGKC